MREGWSVLERAALPGEPAAAGNESAVSIGVTVMSKDQLSAKVLGLVAVCVQ